MYSMKKGNSEISVFYPTIIQQTCLLSDDIYPDEIEDFISEALFNEFDTIAEDGSLRVASKNYFYLDNISKYKQ